MGALDRVRAEFGCHRSDAGKTGNRAFAGSAGTPSGQVAELAVSSPLESRISALASRWHLDVSTAAIMSDAQRPAGKWLPAILRIEGSEGNLPIGLLRADEKRSSSCD